MPGQMCAIMTYGPAYVFRETIDRPDTKYAKLTCAITGRQFIRPYMPEQHRAFYESLEYVFIGIRGQDGMPCAFCLAGEKGFVYSPSPTELVVDLHHGIDIGEGKWFL